MSVNFISLSLLCRLVHEDAAGEVLHGVFLHELQRLDRGHVPVRRAVRQQLHEGEAEALHLVLHGLLDARLRLADVRGVVQREPGDVHRGLKFLYELAHPQRITHGVRVAAVDAGGGFLAHQRGRGHLAAGHAVGGVVREENGDMLAAVGGHHDLRKADGCQVAVALIGKDEGIGAAPLYARRHGGSPAVGRGDHVELPVETVHGRAADGQYVYDFLSDAQFVDGLGDELSRERVQAAGAEAAGQRQQAFRFCIHLLNRHHCSPPSMILRTAAFVLSSSSSMPPLLPYSYTGARPSTCSSMSSRMSAGMDISMSIRPFTFV